MLPKEARLQTKGLLGDRCWSMEKIKVKRIEFYMDCGQIVGFEVPDKKIKDTIEVIKAAFETRKHTLTVQGGTIHIAVSKINLFQVREVVKEVKSIDTDGKESIDTDGK
jgi:hypothetical protein